MTCAHRNTLPLDESLDAKHAVLRVLCRLETAEYNSYRDEGLTRWYVAGFDFIRKHHKAVVFDEI